MRPLRTIVLGMNAHGVGRLGICAPGVPGRSPAPGSFPVWPRRRYRLGAGALLAVLLLAAIAGTGLAAHYAAQHAARQTAMAFQAGRVFAAWVLAAHRASQEQEFGARLTVEPSFVLTPGALRGLGAVPPGLPENVGRDVSFTVGIMDDGTAIPGRSPVAMAFGVLEPAGPEAGAALRQGAIAAGLAALAEAGSAATVMAAHVPGIERGLGRPLAAPALYVTADAGLRYRDQALYRRAQPGRPGLNRMETVLDAGGNDVTGVAAAEGFTASLSEDGTAGGGGTVTGDARAARLEAESLEAGALAAASLSVSMELVVGRAAAGPVTTETALVSGRLEGTAMTAAGALTAQTLAVASTAVITGASSARSLAGEMVDVKGEARAQRIESTGLHGPDATIGSLSVGSCGGC